MEIREIQKADLKPLLALYTQLHDNPMPVFDKKLEHIWDEILLDENHHILVGVVGNAIVSSCVLVVIPNLTQSQRPYALIENIITHAAHRNKGYATQLLHHAAALARKENCYKIMLLTGSKKESTLQFYEQAGFNKNDKTAFVQWLD